ncbi:hypothetical protein P5673_026230 [Acropora cervicornis]|uniref:MD-2-related lipid-recognition domain-containing protein n=1 Tax=Acropora cervicornis TaxID=6130 RepID=A0AAD9Q1F4_ACRCE|nr:hypothetical protein P5673_026230 [Acropora cervicornis]
MGSCPTLSILPYQRFTVEPGSSIPEKLLSFNGYNTKSFRQSPPLSEHGSDHSNAKIEITPWPFIAYEHILNFTFSITPAVNIFDIIAAIEISKLPGGQILFKNRRDICNNLDDKCTMLAGETYVFRGAYVLHDFLPGLSMTVRWTAKAYNEDLYEFLCVEAVALKS